MNLTQMPTEVMMKTIEMEKRRVYVEQGISLGSTFTDSIRYEQQINEVINMMAHRLSAEVVSHKVVSDTAEGHVDIPTNWWQMLKRDLNIKWVNKLWPIKTNRYTVEAKFERFSLYPEANINVPQDKFGIPVRVDNMTVTREGF